MTQEEEAQNLELLKAQIANLRHTAKALDENEGRVANSIVLLTLYGIIEILGRLESEISSLKKENEISIIT